MSITPRIPSLIPESAPFTPEQRTWLNGLFAGMISLEESVTPLSDEQAAKLMPGLLERGAPAEEDDGAPWHDPAMPLPDRMKLADGKPLPRRLMAAMAQQDCSQCGYNCKDYAEALFTKKGHRPHAQESICRTRAGGACGEGRRRACAGRAGVGARPLAR